MDGQSKIIHLTINGKTVEVEAGKTILQAAAKLGIVIPAMCYKDGCSASTSCLVCVVQNEASSTLTPSCGALAVDGIKIRTDTPEVLAARKSALELLLSEHAGDCEGPCRIGCPAGMDIPKMICEIAAGRMASAIQTIKADIAIPAVLGRICPAPCEKVCRRSQADSAISICLLKRFVADWDLASSNPYRPVCKPDCGKKVAIIGSGPAGLAAAYYLAQQGVKSILFEKNNRPGGNLHNAEKDILPQSVLDSEINKILTLKSIEFRNNIEIGSITKFEDLYRGYDAVFIATGRADISHFGLEMSLKGLKIDLKNYQTSRKGVFAGGEAAGRRRLAVRAAADGKEAAVSIEQYLMGQELTGPIDKFNSRLGQLEKSEIEAFFVDVEAGQRKEPADLKLGFTSKEAVYEAQRCLRCDCGKKQDCILRKLAESNQARQQAYKGQRKPFTRQINASGLVFEAGKCILCGLCVQIARKNIDQAGLSFAGRGFKTRISVALEKSLEAGLSTESARECVKICPTGALSWREK